MVAAACCSDVVRAGSGGGHRVLAQEGGPWRHASAIKCGVRGAVQRVSGSLLAGGLGGI